jgi:hypothetical protein
MNREGNWVLVELEEQEAAFRELKAGWSLLDCIGDDLLKQIYLEQELTSADKQAWCDGMVTEHSREAFNQIGGLESNEVTIEYNRAHRQYEVEVKERITAHLPEPNIILHKPNFTTL